MEPQRGENAEQGIGDDAEQGVGGNADVAMEDEPQQSDPKEQKKAEHAGLAQSPKTLIFHSLVF